MGTNKRPRKLVKCGVFEPSGLPDGTEAETSPLPFLFIWTQLEASGLTASLSICPAR